MLVEVHGNILNPRVLVIGVVHGDEPQGYFLINEYLSIMPDTKLLMIPCLNKTGFEQRCRTNINGVDINRNFPTKNWVKSKKDEYYGGDSPSSEQETREITALIEKYNPKLILTIHAPYRIVNYDGPALDVAEKISGIINYPVQKDIGYPTPGSLGTWAGIERNIPVITLELDETKSINDLEKTVFEIFKFLENY